MKKITLVLVFLLTMVMGSYGQVSYVYGWEPTADPLGGWTSEPFGFSRQTITPCTSLASVRANTYDGNPRSLTSPLLGVSNGGIVTFSFDYKVTNWPSNDVGTPANQVQIITEWSNALTGPWFPIGTIGEANHAVSATCAPFSFQFSPTPGNLFIRYRTISINDADVYYYFDNVSLTQGAPPTCVSPSNLAASNITASSATIDWAATNPTPALGYEYYVSNVNVAPAVSGTSTTATTADLTGLTSNTNNYFWVRSICTDGQSVWSGPISFRTLCVSFVIPFFENFNSDSSSESCWQVLNVNGDDDAWNLNYATTPIEGNQSANLYTDFNSGANDDWLISPKITLTGNEQLSFRSKVQSATEPNDFRVVLSTTGNIPSDFTTELIPLTQISNTTDIKTVISLAAYTGDVFVAWHVPSGGLDGWRLYIDDIAFEPIPSMPPLCIGDMNAVANEGCGNFPTVFTWSAVPGADGYAVSIGTSPNGADLVVNNVNINSALTYSFSGSPSTTYYYTIRPYNANAPAVDCFEDTFTTYDDGCFCAAVPASGNNGGITNVKVGETDFPVPAAMPVLTYNNLTSQGTVDIAQGVNTFIKISYATGFTYNTNIWVDFNDNYTFEPSELIYVGESLSPNPTILTASFVTPLTAGLGQHRMRIVGSNDLQTPVNPCYSGTQGSVVDLLVNVLPAPACLPPTASTVSNITANGATLNWVSTGTLFNVEVDFAGFTQGTGVVTSGITGLTTTLTGLDAQADYAYYIQTDCGSGSLSPWTGPFTFRTACESFGDFEEDFTTEITRPAPECWKTLVNSTSTFSAVSNNSFNDYMNLSNSADAAAALYLITPSLTDLPLNTHRIKFRASSFTVGATLVVGTMSDPAAASTFTAVQTIPLTGVFANYSVAFLNSTTDSYIAFRFIGTATFQTVNIDDVIWEAEPTCPDVYVVNFISSTPTTADISWTPGGTETAWQYAYGLDTETDPSGLTPVDVTITPSTTITGLTANTSYKVWVRASCGGEYGQWSPAITFLTACLPVTTFPWTEGFENITPGNDVFPVCWSRENGQFSTAIASTWNTPRTGTNYLRNNWDATNEYMWTPGFELTAGVSYDFSFYMQGDGYTGWTVGVFQNTVQNSVGATQLGGTTTASGTGSYVIQPYALVSNTIVPTTTGTYYFAVRVNQPSGNPWYIAFDDFRMEPTPTCLAPLAPTSADVTVATATMNWVATTPAPANGYDYYVSSTAVAPNATTVPTGTVAAGITTASLTALSASTIYKVYVRSLCGANDFSSWSDAATFTTACISATLPYTINFEAVTVPNLPLCTTTQNVGTGNNWKTVSNPGAGFTTKALNYAYNSVNSANTWFYTNTVSLTAGTTYSVSYDYGNDFAFYTESLKVAYGSTANAAAMTTIIADHPTINQAALQSNITTFTPAVSGDYVIGFNAYSIEDQNQLYVDNIVIQEVLATGNFDNNSFTAYPNPVKDVLNVSFTQNISDVSVYNLLGQQVLFMNMDANKGQIDMSSLTSGTYLVKISTENAVKTIKVIKQ